MRKIPSLDTLLHYLEIKKPEPFHDYTVIKHDGHLRTRGTCRQYEPHGLKCNTRLRLLHLLSDIELMW